MLATLADVRRLRGNEVPHRFLQTGLHGAGFGDRGQTERQGPADRTSAEQKQRNRRTYGCAFEGEARLDNERLQLIDPAYNLRQLPD